MPCDRIASATRAPKSTSTTPSGCGRLLHDRRRAPALDVRLGHLQADVAAADDDDAPARLRRQRQQRLGVVERLHAVDEREVDAREVGAHRFAAGGQHQPVEADAVDAAGVLVEELDLPGVEVDGRCLVVRAHVDAAPAVLVGRAGDERLDTAGDDATDDERDAARRVAREPRRLQHDDLGVGFPGADPCRRRHPRGVTADDHDLDDIARFYSASGGRAPLRSGGAAREVRRAAWLRVEPE